MKVIAILLSMLILSLTVIPCSDSYTCDANNIAQSDHSHSEDTNDNCSPFCICACCGCMGFMFQGYPAYTLKTAPQNSKLVAFKYSAFFPSAFVAIWQPPKLV